jgi:hypothetical protein
MLYTGRDHYCPVILNLMFFAIQDDFPPTRLKTNELIEIVNFHILKKKTT